MKDSESNLILKIAAGVVLGGLFLTGLQSYRERMAIAEANKQIAQFAAEAQQQSQQIQQEFAVHAQARQQAQVDRAHMELESRQLTANQRCIGKDLFRRVDNGWVQVIDGSAQRKCGR